MAFLASLLLTPDSALAKQQIRQAFFAVYPNAVNSRLDVLPSTGGEHCGVCHYQFGGAGDRNPYGLAIEAVLGNYPNNDNGRQQAIMSIENDDSDGDGFSQLVEVTDVDNYGNTPTFPGLTPDNVHMVTEVDVNDILAYLVPQEGADAEPPTVMVITPDGGESWGGGSAQTVTWNAIDNVDVVSVDIFYRDEESEDWKMIGQALDNTGVFQWFVHNTPTTDARVRVLARDAMGNEGEDLSDNVFTITQQPGGIVPTTLRDFEQPGTQPFEGGTFQDPLVCSACHGNYDHEVEPYWNWEGSMMAQAARDPLFYACLAIAEQDAPSSGDLCLRCHTPFGWLGGRSQPTDGSQLTPFDRNGLACNFCHRMVDPIYDEGVDPPEDEEILSNLDDVPIGYSNGQYVIDPQNRRRGPYSDPVSPHPWLESPFHRSSNLCGTCHDVSNPVFERISGADYAPGPLDEEASVVASHVLLPLERTYSEWLNSEFPNGVFAPDFAGNKPDGIVASCQDCHMRDVEGKGCNDPSAPTRPDLGLHDMMGGSSWMPTILDQVYPGEVVPEALAEGSARAVSILEKAALLDLFAEAEGDSYRAEVTVTNRSGHKLPTGYPEGRRMWIHVVAFDSGDNVVYESGAYDFGTGLLTHDEDAVIYEAKMGISPDLADALGVTAGESFHFTLNDSLYKDNRIPPMGFTNADYEVFGGAPVDPHHEGPAPRYEDGQYWDVATYGLPSSTNMIVATLYYQSTSKEYIEFLRDENETNSTGQDLYDLWDANGRGAPVAMVADTAFVESSGLPTGSTLAESRLSLAGPNPFAGSLRLALTLTKPEDVVLQIYDPQGRQVTERELGMLGGGPQLIQWDGRDDNGSEVGSGVYWVRVLAGREAFKARVVRIQ
jgi:hypothetical protein